MKKSNKLLLGGFSAGILFITAMHLTIYAKYKSGDYSTFNIEDELGSYAMQSFPHILFVSVRNVPDATVKFGDVAQVQKDEEAIQYVQKGDTLLITGSDSTHQKNIRQPVIFNVPYNAILSVFNSSLSFKAGKKTAENNPVIYLQKSQCLFSEDSDLLQFGHMKVMASDSSGVAFHGNTQVNDLDVQLSNSSMEYMDGNLGQLSILTDPVSRISLQSKHLAKTKVTTKPN
jgi:hypothetical protein